MGQHQPLDVPRRGSFAGLAEWEATAAGLTLPDVATHRYRDFPFLFTPYWWHWYCERAGRTDAGVHAEGLGVSCALPERWQPADLRRALNALLPADCWAESVHEMHPGFHARRSALTRRYRYLIGTDDAAASRLR